MILGEMETFSYLSLQGCLFLAKLSLEAAFLLLHNPQILQRLLQAIIALALNLRSFVQLPLHLIQSSFQVILLKTKNHSTRNKFHRFLHCVYTYPLAFNLSNLLHQGANTLTHSLGIDIQNCIAAVMAV